MKKATSLLLGFLLLASLAATGVTAMTNGDVISFEAVKAFNNLRANNSSVFGVRIENWYTVEAYRDGKLMWREYFPNVATRVGKALLFDCTLKTGSCSVANLYIGLTQSAGSYVSTDTMAAHAGWTEFTNYDEANRQAWTTSAISAGQDTVTLSTDAGSEATYTIATGSGQTVDGCFLCVGTNCSTKSNNTGTTLMGVGQFTGGARTGLNDNDILKVTLTSSLA